MLHESNLEYDVQTGNSDPVLRLKTKKERRQIMLKGCLIELICYGLFALAAFVLWFWWNPLGTHRG